MPSSKNSAKGDEELVASSGIKHFLFFLAHSLAKVSFQPPDRCITFDGLIKRKEKEKNRQLTIGYQQIYL